ncbi:ABC transporter substrate binding protein [Thalassotalea fusca]
MRYARQLVVLMLLLLTAKAIASLETEPRILLLNSYHAQYRWTADLTKGVQDELSAVIPTENLHVEFMDERRFIDDDVYHRKLLDLYNYKYAINKPSLIITSDDPAFNFILEHGEEMFPGIPIVFSGVNVFNENRISGKPWITGIVEGQAIQENLELIATVQPEVKRIILLADNTGFGYQLYLSAKELEQSWRVNSKYNHITLDIRNTFDKQSLALQAKSFDKQTAILLLAIHYDVNGKYFSYDNDVPFLSKHSKAPIYGMWGSLLLDKGVIGGVVNNPYKHGKNAANIAVRILAGEDIRNIPVKTKAVYSPAFNHNQLERFEIDRTLLPNNALVVAAPDSFYDKYTTAVNSAVATLIGLVLIIVMLVLNIAQRRSAQKQLKAFNRNLEKMVAERTFELDERNRALEQARAKLESLAFNDSLTSLGNRRAANDYLKRFLARSVIDNQPLAIALVDIDHFKRINDNFGHLIGDQVLENVAKCMASSIRPSDYVFRWGGEEFLILLPATNFFGAEQVCQRVRTNVASLSIEQVSTVTVSIGVTVAKSSDTTDSLLQIVDDALYKAKASGRNTIVIDQRRVD